jgi:hypothetical protein
MVGIYAHKTTQQRNNFRAHFLFKDQFSSIYATATSKSLHQRNQCKRQCALLAAVS